MTKTKVAPFYLGHVVFSDRKSLFPKSVGTGFK